MKHTDITTLLQVSQLKLDLIAVKSLIADEANWCQGRSARVSPTGTTQRCLLGAIVAFRSGKRAWDVGHALTGAAKALDPRCCGYISFNDSHTHAEVMAMFDAAIERA